MFKAKTVAEVLKGADKFVDDLKMATELEAAKAENKSKEVAALQAEVQELDKSVNRGKKVAAKFEAMLTAED